MRFRVLSHAGLEVNAGGASLLCDPWIIGSVYWRSWWNYPPVSRELIDSLHPDAIYLTHVHWDHFQGISLRKLGLDKRIVIPLEPCGRMKTDLEIMGFRDIVELAHGESLSLAPDFSITSYHFGPYLDSVLVIEADGRVILNCNDAKLMGGPLQQVLRRHPHIDFLLRSHSSANSRICYELMDRPQVSVDNPERYTRDFAEFAVATGARYAIPFASNHCHLHRETFRFNDLVTTPLMVKQYFEEHGIERPQLQVMVSGDSWSEEEGFAIQEHDYFENRSQRLAEYRDRNRASLEKTYAREDAAVIRLGTVQRYFDKAFAATPWLLRRQFKGNPILFVLYAGERRFLFEVDFHAKSVREISSYDDDSHPIQVHLAAALMRHCCNSRLFAHLGASHRVRYRMRSDKKRYVDLLNHFYQLYEYDVLPLHANLNRRFLGAWLRRWRELPLYLRLARDIALGRGTDIRRYLPAPRPERLAPTAAQPSS